MNVLGVHPLRYFIAVTFFLGCKGSAFTTKHSDAEGGSAATSSSESFSTSATESESSSETVSNSGSGGGAPATSCDPTKTDSPVANECGIFVGGSNASDDNPGTKEAPLATIAKGISLAADGIGRVYVCAQEYHESVDLTHDIEMIGGIDCTTYMYQEQKTTIAPAAGKLPIRVAAGLTVMMQDIAMEAYAQDVNNDSDSNISSTAAIIGEGAEVQFTRCDFFAGEGHDGLDSDSLDPAADGVNGNNGSSGCFSSQVLAGGVSIENPSCSESIGGAGGIGGVLQGGSGTVGSPGNTAAGTGQTDSSVCTSGSNGADGENGEPGSGAAQLGTIDFSGYEGNQGQNGTSGTAGHGGGGGGGSRGASVCGDYTIAGNCGGSGSTGGCGGSGGEGGHFGGSSIGIVSLNASVLLTDVTIVTSDAGRGGDGAEGQEGGIGGSVAGASGGTGACSGGLGGSGGKGGTGGGGQGGHSVGIAYNGSEPIQTNVSITVGEYGSGGAGVAIGDGTYGASGEACTTLNFEDGSCTK